MFFRRNVCVLAGVLAGSALGDTATYGLDAVFPAVPAALPLPALVCFERLGAVPLARRATSELAAPEGC